MASRLETTASRSADRAIRQLALAGAVVAIALGAAAWAWWSGMRPAAGGGSTIARVGQPAPEIALPLAGGGMADLQAERGNVVLVNFWATWCEPCRAEMPGLQQLRDQLHGQPFRLYSIDLQEDPDSIAAFERELGLRLDVLIDGDGTVTRAYGVRALPATFLVDRQGVLRQQHLGPLLTGGVDTMWTTAWVAAQVRDLLGNG
jgi:thiol-disulfide isomerase/thioredoxin